MNERLSDQGCSLVDAPRLARTAGAVLIGLVLTAAAQGQDCREIIRKHGYLSQAQFECEFESYNEALIDAAEECDTAIGKEEGTELLTEGMEQAVTGARRAADGAAWCEEILERFPGDVGR